jgi:hypothetical protein
MNFKSILSYIGLGLIKTVGSEIDDAYGTNLFTIVCLWFQPEGNTNLIVNAAIGSIW